MLIPADGRFTTPSGHSSDSKADTLLSLTAATGLGNAR